MIAHIQGTILESLEKSLILQTASGLGYEVFVSDSLLTKNLNTPLSLYTKLIIKDDAHDLYGFTTLLERDFFIRLCSVSGVGPRSALGILSISPIPHTAAAIKKGEITFLTRVSGIGKKAAEKIILELKDKMTPFENEDKDAREIKLYTHLFDVLRSLGHTDSEIRDILQTLDMTKSEAVLLKEAIQKLVN
jgi:holliday junction DNA helicase RuvA